MYFCTFSKQKKMSITRIFLQIYKHLIKSLKHIMEIHINNWNRYSNILTQFQQLSTWITLHHKELRMNKIQIMVKLLHNHQQNMAVPVLFIKKNYNFDNNNIADALGNRYCEHNNKEFICKSCHVTEGRKIWLGTESSSTVEYTSIKYLFSTISPQ